MLDSVLVQMKGAYDSFWASKRIEWISKSCGQIIQTVSRTTWTKEVVMNTTNIHHQIYIQILALKCQMMFRNLQMEDAITSNTLIKYVVKCNDNITDVIALIRDTTSPGLLINLESLLILDVQGVFNM